MSAVLVADDLQRRYEARRGMFARPATVHALAGVSFAVEAGRTLAVVGLSEPAPTVPVSGAGSNPGEQP